MEITYILRSSYNFAEDYDVMLPLDIDSPNNSSMPEIELGRWNRRAEIDMFTIHIRKL